MIRFFLAIVDFFSKICYNFSCHNFVIGGSPIKKLKAKRKKWLEFRNNKLRKKVHKLKKKEKRLKRYLELQEIANRVYNKKRDTFIATAPEVFSIVDNTEETISYFNRIINELSKRNFDELFYFDLSKVTSLTIDAVMYISAILRNIKGGKVYRYSFTGNEPLNDSAKNFFRESGFYGYVKSNVINIESSSNKLQIISGNTVDVDVVKTVCDFVNKVCRTRLSFTYQLYDILIELMTNTKQHAYKGKDVLFVNHWYVFVEDYNNVVKFVFLDTGEGIPGTIHKKWYESLPFLINDSSLICSALKGEFRTETRSENRGKGLPALSEYCINGRFKNLQVYSGSGYCKVLENNDGPYMLCDVNDKIFGTLFCWEICKDNIMEEYKI